MMTSNRVFALGEAAPDSAVGFHPRGGARKLWKCRDHEVILSGPSETGKTYAALQKLDSLLWKYAGSEAVIVRKSLSSVYPSVLKTYRNILGTDGLVTFYGGEKPEWAIYPNGSRCHIAGMDNPRKALSSERDFIYVNQAEELSLDDWETLTTRCTGRAAHSPYPQMMGDCNPWFPSHWIKHRPSLTLLESRHEDNPTLFDEAGRITVRGERSLAILDRLTGARYLRLRKGLWVQAEGVVYEGWDPAVHHVKPFPIPSDWRRIMAIDFGYTNPFCCQWWAIDPDGRMYLYREIYRTQRTVSDHATLINELSGGENIEATICDHDAEDRATLLQNGIRNLPAYKAIRPGIQAVEQRLRRAGDGRPRLVVFRDALVSRDEALAAAKQPVCTADEFEVYVWPKDQSGRSQKETPVDASNHGMDTMRYAVAYLDLVPQPGASVVAGERTGFEGFTLAYPYDGSFY